MLKISFLGGIGEFGRNMTLYEKDGFCLIVDCGMMFADSESFGVDRIIPDFQYILDRKDSLKFVVILTHSHEDHIGALPFLIKYMDIPVYASPFAIGVLKKKFEESEIEFPEFYNLSEIEKFYFGPFEIEKIFVTHSTPESYSLLIRTNDGIFLHTSDFKFDQTPLDLNLTEYYKFQKAGAEGITGLLIDSTNVETKGISLSEKAILKNLEKYIASFKNRLLITLFSTNIQRIQGIINLASKYRKKVAFVGRTILTNVEVAERLGHLRIPENTRISIDRIDSYGPNEVIAIVTGSQGEPFSALSRIAFDELKEISIEKDDLVIYSARIIPGNEKRIGRIINQIYKKGGKVITPKDDLVHCSGHAAEEEIKLLVSWIRPKYYIPIHGEYRQLMENAEIAREFGFPERNILIKEVGDSLIFKNGEFITTEKIPASMVWLDGETQDPIEKLILRDRKQLAYEGFILPIVVINKLEGKFESEPEIISRGYIGLENQNEFFEDIKRSVKSLEKELSKEELGDNNILKAKIKSTVKRELKKRDAKIPLVIPVVMEV